MDNCPSIKIENPNQNGKGNGFMVQRYTKLPVITNEKWLMWKLLKYVHFCGLRHHEGIWLIIFQKYQYNNNFFPYKQKKEGGIIKKQKPLPWRIKWT